jgi:4-hydroxybenzoate polyprenyltransferase
LRSTLAPFALLVAVRPHNGLACALLVLAGLHLPGLLQAGWQTMAVLVAVFLLTCASHLVNDIVDLAADRINRPTRPLPSGHLALAQARSAAFVLWLAGLLAGLCCLPGWWPWCLFWSLAGPGYSLLAKGRGWLAPIWTAVVVASCYVAGAAQRSFRALDIGIAVIVGYFVFYREYIKTLEDTGGDSPAGHQTLAGGKWDRAMAAWLFSLPLILVGMALVLVGPATRWLQLAGMAFLGFVVASLLSLPGSRWRHEHKSGSLLKLGAYSGLGILLVLGST